MECSEETQASYFWNFSTITRQTQPLVCVLSYNYRLL